jgi:hypothetical protein
MHRGAIQEECITEAVSNWTSAPITSIGVGSLAEVTTMDFIIPKVIPSTAKEVLILATVYTYSVSTNPLTNIKIYTQIGFTQYEKYLSYIPYSSTGIMVNSDNLWFPMPTNGLVFVNVPYALGDASKGSVQLYAIGYR